MEAIENQEIKEVYAEDTVGRKQHVPIVSKTQWGNAPKTESDVMTYNLNRPMKWKEFKELPPHIKKEYVRFLNTKYHASTAVIADMLGYDRSGFGKHLKSRGLLPETYAVTRMNAKHVIAWKKFLGKDPMADAPVEVKPEVQVQAVPENKKLEFDFGCDLLDFKAIGEFSIEKLTRFITASIPDGTKCKVSVRIEKLADATVNADIGGFGYEWPEV